MLILSHEQVRLPIAVAARYLNSSSIDVVSLRTPSLLWQWGLGTGVVY